SEARTLRRFSPRRQGAFNGREAPFEFEIGVTQDALGVGIEMTGKVDYGEQKIANLSTHAALVGVVELPLNLVRFLPDLGQDGFRIVPVKPHPPGSVLQLQCAG